MEVCEVQGDYQTSKNAGDSNCNSDTTDHHLNSSTIEV